ncbi:hypothetical protein H0H92_006161 [Tricholoma furcatifolium]|nr:hypothetical protein H0H92_006161 [Tricholoma furcatifolium]
MTKRQWTTPKQRAQLESLLPEFVDAQKDGTTSTHFYPKAYAHWWARNPYPNPNAAEIDAAAAEDYKKIVAKAKAAKTSVPAKDNSAEYREKLTKALQATQRKHQEKRIFEWFHNHTRSTTSGTGKRSALKLGPKRPMQAWQAFGKMMDEDEKDELEAEYLEYVKSVDLDTKPMTKLTWSMSVLKQRLKDASQQVKDEVEEFRLKGVGNDDERNAGYQDAIDRLPRTLKLFRDTIAEQAGWSVLIIVGGPHGKNGKVGNMIVEGGPRTSDGKTFSESMPMETFEDNILKPFEEFLDSVFSPEVCQSRLVKTPSSPIMRHALPINIDSDDEAMAGEPDAGEQDSGEQDTGSTAEVLQTGPGTSVSDAPAPSEAPSTPDITPIMNETATESVVAKPPTSKSTGTSASAGEQEAGLSTEVSQMGPDTSASDAPAPSEAASTPDITPITNKTATESANTITTLSMNEVVSNAMTTAADAAATLQSYDLQGLPAWASQALDFFVDIRMAESATTMIWKDLINEWAKFEVSSGTESRSRLPTESRPEEIQWWMKRKRLFTNVPKICSPEYSVSFEKWWREMQPSWRTESANDGEALSRDVPTGGKWERMLSAGNNGMFLVIVALAFWALAPDVATTQGKLEAAIDDVLWVFKAMLAMLHEAGKHGIEEAGEEGPQSKRRRLRK